MGCTCRKCLGPKGLGDICLYENKEKEKMSFDTHECLCRTNAGGICTLSGCMCRHHSPMTVEMHRNHVIASPEASSAAEARNEPAVETAPSEAPKCVCRSRCDQIGGRCGWQKCDWCKNPRTKMNLDRISYISMDCGCSYKRDIVTRDCLYVCSKHSGQFWNFFKATLT